MSRFSMCWYAYHYLSPVIVDYFDRFRTITPPFKTNTVLIIYSDTVLTFSVSRQNLQFVTLRYCQILNQYRRVELIQFAPGNFPNMNRANSAGSLRIFTVKNIFSPTIFERYYHKRTISRIPCFFKKIENGMPGIQARTSMSIRGPHPTSSVFIRGHVAAVPSDSGSGSRPGQRASPKSGSDRTRRHHRNRTLRAGRGNSGPRP